MARSVLLVSQVAPPGGFSAGRRIAGLTKYLDRLGHRVTVLTSRAFGPGPIPGASRVIRTRDLVATRLNPRRERFELIRDGEQASVDGESYEGGHSPVAMAVVPDLSLIGWLPFAFPRALALARRERFDCVITTSPPESGHFIGMALRRQGMPWIADFRDGWAFETTHPDWPLPAQHRLDAALERAVARRADVVVGVTDPITEHLRDRVGADAVTITNGFDPEEPVAEEPVADLLSPDRHSLVHTGRMAFAARSPRPVIEALRQLREQAPELAARIELVFAGPLSTEEREAIEDPDLGDSVRTVGTLDHPTTLALQRAADGLLLLTGRSRRSEATAKLFEYLATGRPILVLGEHTAAGDIVLGARAGIVTSASDPKEIAVALRELVERGDAASAGAALERFSYPVLAAQLADQIEHVVAASRAGGGGLSRRAGPRRPPSDSRSSSAS